MVDVGCGLADDLKEFSHKAKAIFDGVLERTKVIGYLNLSFRWIEEPTINQTMNLGIPGSTIE